MKIMVIKIMTVAACLVIAVWSATAYAVGLGTFRITPPITTAAPQPAAPHTAANAGLNSAGTSGTSGSLSNPGAPGTSNAPGTSVGITAGLNESTDVTNSSLVGPVVGPPPNPETRPDIGGTLNVGTLDAAG